jgi:predicted amidohydrolase
VTRVACQQLAPAIGDLEANRKLCLAAIDEAVDAGAEVIILPELITSGYMFTSIEEAAEVAIEPDHELLREWADVAARADVVVIGGFCERGPPAGSVYNSAAVVDAGGLRAVYRKLHLWDNEHAIFTPGSAAPPVIETRVGRIGVVICYDLEFPELTRSVALAGAQLLAVPTNWPLFPRPDGERPSEVTIAMATGRINKMAVACADRLGLERGQDWTGGATIVDPDGWVAAESRAAGMVIADIDLERAIDKRLTDRADVFGDRRPELYGAVVAGGHRNER